MATLPRFNSGIVVLGKKLLPDGSPSNVLKHRVARAVEVFKKEIQEGKNCAMIVTGGVVMKNTRPEAHVMRELAMAHGISSENIFMEEKAQNTPENMIFTRRILDELGIKYIILITSDFHMERAKLYAQAFIPHTEGFVIHTEADYPQIDNDIKKEIEKEKQSIQFVSGRVRKYSAMLKEGKI